MSSARSSAIISANSMLEAALSTEVSRGVVRDGSVASQTSSLSTQLTSMINSALSAEASRADAACNTLILTKNANPPTQDGTTDYKTCSTGGSVYFSTSNSNYFICTGLCAWLL
jgi:hypothetical protein